MSRGIREYANVVLTVNSDQAQKMMSDLKDEIDKTEQSIASMKAAMADPKKIEKAKSHLKKLKQQLSEMQSATEGVNDALSNLDSATPRQLEKALRTLNKQLKDMIPGSEVWEGHVEQIKILKERLAELRDELSEDESLWDKIKDFANDNGAAIVGLVMAYDEVVATLRDYVDAYAEMEQEMANVRKFTGMTSEEVERLNEAFNEIDTRTSRAELNQLAQEAGRLGKTSVEDVLGFVRAADKINVALDDLGEGATLTLSKLTGTFGVEEEFGTESALLKVGSVINELSQNCAASAPYLTNFTERMAGVGAQAGMTIQQLMGFAAVLDNDSQKVEKSATAISQLIVRMMQDPAKYARVAGIEVDKFTRMIKEDTNGALILFLETLNKAGGMDVLSPMFKDMGENSSGAIAALSDLAKNIEMVKAQQLVANQAFEEGTSIDIEFAVQNETVEAGLEKCKKRAQELKIELGERLNPVMRYLTTSTSAITKGLLILVRFIGDNVKTLVTLTAATVAYIAVCKIHALWVGRVAIAEQIAAKWTKAWTAVMRAVPGVVAAGRLAVASLNVAVTFLTNGFRVNTAAMTRWKTAWSKMSFTGWAAVITVVATAVLLLYQRIKRTREEMLTLENVRREAAQKMGEQESKIRLLIAAAEDETLSMETRQKAVDKLNATIPKYNAQIDETTGKYRASTEALQEYLKALSRQYELEGAREKLAELGKKKADKIVEISNAEKDVEKAERMYALVRPQSGKISDRSSPAAYESALVNLTLKQGALSKLNKELEKIEKQEQQIFDAYGVDLKQDAAENMSIVPDVESGENGFSGAGGAGDDDADKKNTDRFAREKAWRERQEAEARIAYAKGETLYSEHTERMAGIERDYWQLILDRSDLSEQERLTTLASYWEAVNKVDKANVAVSKERSEQLVKDETDEYNGQLDMLRRMHLRRLADESMTAEQHLTENERYNEAVELETLAHLKKIRDIYAEGSEEWLTANRKFQEAQIEARSRHLREMEKREAEFAKIKKDTFGLNQGEKDAEFAKQKTALDVVYQRELAAAEGNEAEILRIKEAYMQAELALRKKYSQAGAEDAQSSYSKAISGAAEWLSGEGGQALQQSLSTLISGMSSLFSGLSSLITAELDIQTAAIERRYQSEVDLAQGNSYRIAKAEKEKERRIAKAKNDANKKQFAMQVIQAVAQTAQNALNAYGSAAAIPVVGHVLAPIAAGMAIAAGAIQIAAIKKQQQASEATGYSKGGFTRPGRVDEPAGIVHAGEWVASQKLLANPVARPMIEALDYAQRTNTIGSLRADDVSRSITAPNSLVSLAESDGGSTILAAVAARMSETVDSLTSRLNEPFITISTVTGEFGSLQAEDEYARLIKNKSPKYRRNASRH